MTTVLELHRFLVKDFTDGGTILPYGIAPVVSAPTPQAAVLQLSGLGPDKIRPASRNEAAHFTVRRLDGRRACRRFRIR